MCQNITRTENPIQNIIHLYISLPAGLDKRPPEEWKTRKFDDILLRLCNAVYNQNTIEIWIKKTCIHLFPLK